MLSIRRHPYSNKAYSLVEVVVAAVIFSASAMLVFAVIGKLNQAQGQSAARLSCALMGKKIMESLSKDVVASTWDSGNMSIGTHSGLTDVQFPGCTAFYVVSDASGARKVVMTVNW